MDISLSMTYSLMSVKHTGKQYLYLYVQFPRFECAECSSSLQDILEHQDNPCLAAAPSSLHEPGIAKPPYLCEVVVLNL